MDKILELKNQIWFNKLISSIIIIAVSLIIYKILFHLLEKSEKKNRLNLFNGRKSKTYLKLTKSIIRYVFIVITALILLQNNGVNVSSLLAGVGIIGVVLGLAIQDWLKDIIRGSSIISDNYFAVEDIVKYHDIEGKVLVIGLKTTKIEDIRTGNIISIANRNIEQIEVVSNYIYISVPLPYELPVEKAETIMNSIVLDIKKINNVDDVQYKGVNELADSSINYLLAIKCDPHYKLQARRDALRTVLLKLEENGISVPYNQLDVHQK